MCFRLSVKLDVEQTVPVTRAQAKPPENPANFALSIAPSGTTVNLIWCANEGAQCQSVYEEIRFSGA
jgi:hypothetical protein